MRIYRTCWTGAVVLVSAVAAAAAAPSVGVGPMVATTLALGVLGLTFGVAWAVEGRHWLRPARLGATWFALGGILVMGLPAALGAWSVLVLVMIGSSAPFVVEQTAGAWRARRPARPLDLTERVSDRELMRRWRSTYDEMRRRGCPPETVLCLVQERSQLLDELERRDPVGFEPWLERSLTRETR